jgi:hypothetical protein
MDGHFHGDCIPRNIYLKYELNVDTFDQTTYTLTDEVSK